MDILFYDIRRLKTFLKMLDKQAAIIRKGEKHGTVQQKRHSQIYCDAN